MWHDKKHANSNGANIEIDANVRKSHPIKSMNLSTRILEIVIIFIGIISIIYINTSAYEIKVENTFIIISSLIISILMDLLIIKGILNRYLRVTVFLLVSLLILYFRRSLLNGAIYFINKILYAFSENSTSNIFNIQFNNKCSSKDIYLFLFIAIFILATIISLVIRYQYNIILASLIVVINGVIIIYFCIFPSDFSLILLMAFVVSIVAIEIDYEEIKKKKIIVNFLEYSTKIKVGFLLVTFIVSIFITAIIVYPSKTYKREEVLDALKNGMEDIYYDFPVSEVIRNISTEANGGIDGGELGTVDTLTYDNKVDLLVTIPESILGQIDRDTYLKGFVGGDYTGNSWSEVDEKDYRKYLNNNENRLYQNSNYKSLNYIFNRYDTLDLQDGQLIKSKIKIKNIDANKEYVYAPYNTYYLNNYSYNLFKDLYVYSGTLDSYQFDYYINDNIDSNNLKNIINHDYSKYVYDVYTKLPSGKLEKIKKKYKDFYSKSSYNLEQCIKKVKEDISYDTKYDLSPGKLPKGEDFVEYFLYKNKKGYCSHYASAATVILRAMGIPARYVEGYLISSYEYTYYLNPYKDDIEVLNVNNGTKEKKTLETAYSTVEVTDSNAHAWVEVYDNSLGWIPVEVTPGMSFNKYSSVSNDEVNSRKNNEVINKVNDNKILNTKMKKIIIRTSIIISALTITYLLFIRRYIKLRNKKYSSNTEEILDIYKYILSIFDFLGDKYNSSTSYVQFAKIIESKYGFIQKNEFTDVTYIILKAKYNNKEVEYKDIKRVKKYARRLSNLIYSILPRVGKLKFKYIKNLI